MPRKNSSFSLKEALLTLESWGFLLGGSLLFWSPFFIALGIFLVCEEKISFLSGGFLFLSSFISLVAIWTWEQRYPFHGVTPWLIGWGRFSFRGLCLTLCAAFFCTLKIWFIALPSLDSPRSKVLLTGTVAAIQHTPERSFALLKEARAEGEAPFPFLIRLQLPPEHQFTVLPDDMLQTVVDLKLLPPAVVPYGYDFQWICFFKGIGATAYVKKWQKVTSPPPSHWPSLERILYQGREKIKKWALGHMGQPSGGIATALMTGDRSEIDPRLNVAWRDAGIYHVISISGLHMSMIMLSCFYLLRGGGVGLRLLGGRFMGEGVGLKQGSAAGGLLVSFLYLLLSGTGLPTLRSWLMGGAVFLGIICHQQALSTYILMMSAAVILLIWPESLYDVSFQLSYASVAVMLLASQVQKKIIHQEWPELLTSVTTLFLSGVMVTVITAPLTLFTFQQLTVYGALSNLIVIPLTSFFVMPLPLIALLFIPVGGDGFILNIMGFFIHLTDMIALYVAALPGATLPLPRPPVMSILLGLIGVFASIFYGYRARWIMGSTALLALVLFFLTPSPRPVLFVDPEGKGLLGKTADGWQILGDPRDFVVQQWEKSLLLPEGTVFPSKNENPLVLITGQRVFLRPSSQEISGPCTPSNLFILPPSLPSRECDGTFYTPEIFKRHGGFMQEESGEVHWAKTWSFSQYTK